jgi:thioredoxin family protein
MRSRWVPLVILTVSALALLGVLVSLSVGEHREEQLQISGSGDVQELLGGIHQLGERLGDDDAPIMLTLFTDVQCPHCADYQAGVIDPLIVDLVRTGQAQITLKNFSLGAKEVTLGGIGVEAASAQDHGWQYMEMFMRNQDQAPTEGVNQDFLDEVAGATPGLEVTEWETADADPASEAAAKEDAELAVQQRLTDDIVVYVQGPNGTKELEDAPSRDLIDAAIAAVS